MSTVISLYIFQKNKLYPTTHSTDYCNLYHSHNMRVKNKMLICKSNSSFFKSEVGPVFMGKKLAYSLSDDIKEQTPNKFKNILKAYF